MSSASIYEARNNFSCLVAEAEEGEPVILTRYNKPVAVMISYQEYEEKVLMKERSWFQELREQYADVLDDEGIPLPPKVYPDLNRKIFED